VCLLGTRMSCAKRVELIEMTFGWLNCVGPMNIILDGALLREYVPASYKVPTQNKCIPHCSPAAAGECACSAHAADEYIRRCEGRQLDGLLPNYFEHVFNLESGLPKQKR